MTVYEWLQVQHYPSGLVDAIVDAIKVSKSDEAPTQRSLTRQEIGTVISPLAWSLGKFYKSEPGLRAQMLEGIQQTDNLIQYAIQGAT